MKTEGYEEISKEEFEELHNKERAIFYSLDGKETYYFKKAQKFPICFELDDDHSISLNDAGEIYFYQDGKCIFVIYPKEIPLLVKAVEKAKEVMKKNEKLK